MSDFLVDDELFEEEHLTVSPNHLPANSSKGARKKLEEKLEEKWLAKRLRDEFDDY